MHSDFSTRTQTGLNPSCSSTISMAPFLSYEPIPCQNNGSIAYMSTCITSFEVCPPSNGTGIFWHQYRKERQWWGFRFNLLNDPIHTAEVVLQIICKPVWKSILWSTIPLPWFLWHRISDRCSKINLLSLAAVKELNTWFTWENFASYVIATKFITILIFRALNEEWWLTNPYIISTNHHWVFSLIIGKFLHPSISFGIMYSNDLVVI